MKNYILNIITFIKIGVSNLLVKYLNRSLRFRPKSYLKYLSIRLIAELVKDKESTQYVIDMIAESLCLVMKFTSSQSDLESGLVSKVLP